MTAWPFRSSVVYKLAFIREQSNWPPSSFSSWARMQGKPKNFTDFRLLLDNRTYRMEGKWRDLFQKMKWDVLKSAFKSILGMQGRKFKVWPSSRCAPPDVFSTWNIFWCSCEVYRVAWKHTCRQFSSMWCSSPNMSTENCFWHTAMTCLPKRQA